MKCVETGQNCTTVPCASCPRAPRPESTTAPLPELQVRIEPVRDGPTTTEATDSHLVTRPSTTSYETSTKNWPYATPRTDALFKRHARETKELPIACNSYVRMELATRQVKELLDHARQLERELADMTAARDRTAGLLREAIEENTKLRDAVSARSLRKDEPC